MRLWKTKCERKGHDWLMNSMEREFIPTVDVCLRCGEKRTVLPWGMCLGNHPITDHYTNDGSMIPVGKCRGPH